MNICLGMHANGSAMNVIIGSIAAQYHKEIIEEAAQRFHDYLEDDIADEQQAQIEVRSA